MANEVFEEVFRPGSIWRHRDNPTAEVIILGICRMYVNQQGVWVNAIRHRPKGDAGIDLIMSGSVFDLYYERRP